MRPKKNFNNDDDDDITSRQMKLHLPFNFKFSGDRTAKKPGQSTCSNQITTRHRLQPRRTIETSRFVAQAIETERGAHLEIQIDKIMTPTPWRKNIAII